MSNFFESISADVPKKGFIHELILGAINKLNLVTRQEFATQTQVLIKTRLRVEQLEKKILELIEQNSQQ